MRDPESVDGVEHVVRARGKAFDLRGDFPVVDRFDLDLALVVGVTLPRRDLVFVHRDKLEGMRELASWFDALRVAELTIFRDSDFRWEQRF